MRAEEIRKRLSRALLAKRMEHRDTEFQVHIFDKKPETTSCEADNHAEALNAKELLLNTETHLADGGIESDASTFVNIIP